MNREMKLLLVILAFIGLGYIWLTESQGQSFTTSKSMTASVGQLTAAGFTIDSHVWNMTNAVAGAFGATITSNAPQLLANGGITSVFCGSFIFINSSTSQTVNLFLDSGGTKTEAMVRAGHSVAIDGAPSTLYAQSSTNLYATCTNAVASCSNSSAQCSWAWADF